MFMRAPRLAFAFQVAAFGGVRIALDQRFEPIRGAAEAHALETVEHLGTALHAERWALPVPSSAPLHARRASGAGGADG